MAKEDLTKALECLANDLETFRDNLVVIRDQMAGEH